MVKHPTVYGIGATR